MSQLQMAGMLVQREIEGVEMGIMPDGTPYTTGQGLARLCDAAASTIINQKDQWAAGKRDNKLARLLLDQGFNEPELFTPLTTPKGIVHAYGERVVMTFLEYYAFDSPNASEKARSRYRILSRAGFRLFVYTQLGYDPENKVPLEWREFNDRVRLHSVPPGYWSCFQEMAGVMVTALRNGLVMDHRTVPDGSVGIAWGKHWQDENLDERFGPRRKFDHNFPDYFPQAASNPQDMNIYPLDALPEFRRWMDQVYLPEKFPKYIRGKVIKGLMAASTAQLLLDAVAPPAALPAPKP
jgi:hypothetical protein